MKDDVFTPTDLPGLVYWYDKDDCTPIIEKVTNGVSSRQAEMRWTNYGRTTFRWAAIKWWDKSGNGNHFTEFDSVELHSCPPPEVLQEMRETARKEVAQLGVEKGLKEKYEKSYKEYKIEAEQAEERGRKEGNRYMIKYTILLLSLCILIFLLNPLAWFFGD